MDENAVIQVVGMDKSFPGVHALDKVDFILEKGTIHALLGENGAGKSTFIKLLGGFYTCDIGDIYFEGKKTCFKSPKESIESGIGIIHQELNLAENLSIAENLFLGRMPCSKLGVIDKKYMHRKALEMLEGLGISLEPELKVNKLCIAQQQLIEILRVLSLDAKVVIMDEPTSSLSLAETKILFRLIHQLTEKGISIIYISHKLEEIFEICTDITVLRDGKKVKSLKVKDTNKEELIKLMVGRETTNSRVERNAVDSNMVLECENLLNHKLRDVSFCVKRGEIFGVSGLVGAGKTEIAKAIFGLDELYKGKISLNGLNITGLKSDQICKMGIGYLPEDRKHDGLFLDLSVKANMSISSIKKFTHFGVINSDAEEQELEEQIKKLHTKTSSLAQITKNLSGGNQQKLILSRWLMIDNLKLLIIDEPTRGIDVGAKYEIYNILNELTKQGVSILVMSSEIEELQILCDRIGVVKSGKLMCILDGENCDQETIMLYSLD